MTDLIPNPSHMVQRYQSVPQLLKPVPLKLDGFNPYARMPFGLKSGHVRNALVDLLEHVEINTSSSFKTGKRRLEEILPTSGVSTFVSEYMKSLITDHCKTLVKNRNPSGHPDLIPPGVFPDDSVHHSTVGIEVKASQNTDNWSASNAEAGFLLMTIVEAERNNGGPPIPTPFRIVAVYGASLELADWNSYGKGPDSRRTTNAGANATAREKMKANWIYLDIYESPDEMCKYLDRHVPAWEK